MPSNLFPLCKSALPLTLMVSPLLLATAKPLDLDDRGFVCNVERPSGGSAVETSAQFSWETDGAITQSISQQQHQALVTSERSPSIFSRARWETALQLLLSNPYARPAEASTGSARTRPATVLDADDCIALKARDTEEAIKAQNTFNSALLARSKDELLVSQEPDLLPVLGPVPTGSGNAPVVTPPVVRPTPTVRPRPEAVRPARPAPAPLPPAVVIPSPAPRPSAPMSTPAGLSTGPASFDPNNVTPTTVNPTPFDGLSISTLASKPDGNYRYVSGSAEARTYTDAELQQRGGSIFVLKKEGNRVTGNLLPRLGVPGVCVTGVASGNTVSGTAYPHAAGSADQSDRNTESTLAPFGSGVLQVRQARTENESLYYAGAVLDLSNFTPINAGSSLPPESCGMTPTMASVEE